MHVFIILWEKRTQCIAVLSQDLELEPYNLTAAQKPIIIQTHLHLITCPQTSSLTLSLPSSPDVSII